MKNILRTVKTYEDFIYSLANQYPQIQFSTLVVKRYGSLVAEISGTIFFKNEVKLNIKELIDFRYCTIKTYSYEVFVQNKKQYWYDPQPHPNDQSLRENFPHHKHVPPEIKHNRIPAKQLSFNTENCTTLISEIIEKYFE